MGELKIREVRLEGIVQEGDLVLADIEAVETAPSQNQVIPQGVRDSAIGLPAARAKCDGIRDPREQISNLRIIIHRDAQRTRSL